ncbi:nuclear transport factor 2 family protein, partial [Streptomyces sp. AC550_RSS872]|uniref:nuclear transport factor 2 family protein n=1 Tax=Streptomyces sp. AC550_RSS872 TaxID=2823689 RepID=UPI0020B71D87
QNMTAPPAQNPNEKTGHQTRTPQLPEDHWPVTPEGVTAGVMEKLGQDWDGWTAHDDTYIVDGENVVVLARYTAGNKATGKPVNVRVAHHFTVRGGLIVRFEQFVDTALVRDAMTA